MNREQILSHYHIEPCPIDGLNLMFTEGGRVSEVMWYSTQELAANLWEEDCLFHWTKILRRVWEED